jgi:hypothetical protein
LCPPARQADHPRAVSAADPTTRRDDAIPDPHRASIPAPMLAGAVPAASICDDPPGGRAGDEPWCTLLESSPAAAGPPEPAWSFDQAGNSSVLVDASHLRDPEDRWTGPVAREGAISRGFVGQDHRRAGDQPGSSAGPRFDGRSLASHRASPDLATRGGRGYRRADPENGQPIGSEASATVPPIRPASACEPRHPIPPGFKERPHGLPPPPHSTKPPDPAPR